MPAQGEKFRALLATGRIANLPTVWSNVLAGFWLSSSLIPAYQDSADGQDMRMIMLLVMMIVASMIYVAGCMLGDAADKNFDRQHRPTRPIPSGILSAASVKLGAFSLFALAIISLFFLPQAWALTIQPQLIILAGLLIVLVTSYALLHKKNKPAALLMMASCRFMLVMLAIGAVHQVFWAERPATLIPSTLHMEWLQAWMIMLACSVALYTLLLSWVASTESSPGAFKSRNVLTCLLLAVPAISVPFRFLFSSTGHAAHALALVIIYLWLFHTLAALKTSKPVFVSRALAGFCLLDACFLAPAAPGMAIICLLFFGLALLLQRITPAT